MSDFVDNAGQGCKFVDRSHVILVLAGLPGKDYCVCERHHAQSDVT